MCWKRQLPNSESLVGSVNTTDSPTTEGISLCGRTAILCSNYTGPIRTCLNGGICCDLDGVQHCRCQSGWTEEDCSVRDMPGESLESIYGQGDSFNRVVIVGSLIAVLMLVILIILIVLLLRRYLQRRRLHTTDTSNTRRNGATKLLVNPEDGKTTQIRKDDLSIPVCPGATDSNS